MRKVVFIFFLTTNLIAQEIKISNVQDLYEKGNVTLESSISKKTKVFFNDGLEIAKKLKNDSLIAKGNFYLGEYFYKSSQYLNAIDYFNESLLIYKKLKIYNKISICNRKLGDIYKKSSNFEKALFYYYV